METQHNLYEEQKHNHKRKAIIVSLSILSVLVTATAITVPCVMCTGKKNDNLGSDGHVTLHEIDKQITPRLYRASEPVEFIAFSQYNDNLVDATFHAEWFEENPDIDLSTLINTATSYSSSANVWTITVTPIQQSTEIRGSISFYMDTGKHQSNVIKNVDYWSIVQPYVVGDSFTIRDQQDAQNLVDYIQNVAPWNTNATQPYNHFLKEQGLTFMDLVNCMLGSGNCPLPLSTDIANEAAKPDVATSQSLLNQAQQKNADVLVPYPLNHPDPVHINCGPEAQAQYWTNDQVWVDAAYGTAWNVLVQKARWVQFDWKNNGGVNHLNTVFDQIPTFTLDHWIGSNLDHNVNAPSTEVTETLPFNRKLSQSTSISEPKTRYKSGSVGIFEQQLEAAFRGMQEQFHSLYFGGDYQPFKPSGYEGLIAMGTVEDDVIIIENNPLILPATTFNGWGQADFHVQALTLQLANIQIVMNITENFWMPSYWLHAHDQIGNNEGTQNTKSLYPTFLHDN